MAKRSKKYKQAAKLVTRDADYTLEEACDIVSKTSTVNFNASVDIDLRLGVDPRHADQVVRGSVSLPHGTGKQIQVLALVSEGKQQEAEEAGADYVGLDEYIQKIEDGWTGMDVVVASPDVMGKIGRLGRILGPRGLMPNPKSGTVTDDVAEAIKEAKTGKIDFRVDKQGNLHASIGRVNFETMELRENAATFLQRVMKLRPASAKGLYIRHASMSTTMGPAIPLSRSSVTAA
jgi:large subunit ribosomal protein L1